MKRRIRIECEGKGFTVRDGTFCWRFFATGDGYFVTRTDHIGRETNVQFNSATEAQNFLLEVVSSRLSLSDFWNGQTFLFPTA